MRHLSMALVAFLVLGNAAWAQGKADTGKADGEKKEETRKKDEARRAAIRALNLRRKQERKEASNAARTIVAGFSPFRWYWQYPAWRAAYQAWLKFHRDRNAWTRKLQGNPKLGIPADAQWAKYVAYRQASTLAPFQVQMIKDALNKLYKGVNRYKLHILVYGLQKIIGRKRWVWRHKNRARWKAWLASQKSTRVLTLVEDIRKLTGELRKVDKAYDDKYHEVRTHAQRLAHEQAVVQLRTTHARFAATWSKDHPNLWTLVLIWRRLPKPAWWGRVPHQPSGIVTRPRYSMDQVANLGPFENLAAPVPGGKT